jgi:hypothetical protein
MLIGLVSRLAQLETAFNCSIQRAGLLKKEEKSMRGSLSQQCIVDDLTRISQNNLHIYTNTEGLNLAIP